MNDSEIAKALKPTCETSKRASTPQEHLQRLDIAVHIEDLTVAYNNEPILWDIDMEIPKGVLVAVIGPNGAGKTTLIKAILGLVKPNAGHIYFYGKPTEKQKKIVAYVPQKSSIDWDFPATVYETVMMGTYSGLGWIMRPGKVQKQKTIDALRKVGMLDLKNRQINGLSSSQQQRVFMARALVQDASIFLMDEPFQGVDQATETLIVDILQELRNSGKTALVVHHDLQTVKDYFDWTFLINVRRIAVGSVEDVFTPENLRHAYGAKSGFLSQEQFPGDREEADGVPEISEEEIP